MGMRPVNFPGFLAVHQEDETEARAFGVDLRTVLDFVADEVPSDFEEERAAARRLLEALTLRRLAVFVDPSEGGAL